jgi:hypothetical protein
MSDSDMAKKPRLVRLHVELPDAILAAIDDFRFATRARSRSEAIRYLLNVGQSAQPPDSVSTAQDR